MVYWFHIYILSSLPTPSPSLSNVDIVIFIIKAETYLSYTSTAQYVQYVHMFVYRHLYFYLFQANKTDYKIILLMLIVFIFT